MPAGCEKRQIEASQKPTQRAQSPICPACERATADTRWAVHADARAGAKGWKFVIDRGPRGARHGDDWTDRVMGKTCA